jgi:putative membrane-bound dehydrogenase-like protein
MPLSTVVRPPSLIEETRVKLFVHAAVALAVVALTWQPVRGLPKTDYNQQQSPPRPRPDWVKIIDQGKNDPRLKGYFTPEGIKVEIVADYPVVTNPVGMTFGDDGTLYVLEWKPFSGVSFPEYTETFTYKDGTKRNVATMRKAVRDDKGKVTKVVKDVVKVLRDTTGKGTYDNAKVILEDELPSSILVHDGWLYLSGRGTVRRYKQSKPGGPYDVKQFIAQGFCGFHHHQVSGMTIGNDGWLYITSGDDDNYVEGSDGSRATVLRTGAVFRCRPDGSKMQVFSIGYRNPYRDVAFDSAFNMFHADNDNEDGSKFTGCRLMHVAEESDFGWRLSQGARCCSADFVRGAVFGELPGKLPPLLKTGRGAPAGLLIYNDSRFPEPYRGLLYYPDVFRKLIRAYKVEPLGATFEVTEEFEFLKSDDPLFRPCQMVLGPDGAMYVCDWRTDSGGAGRLWGDNQHGRIYRLSWAGTGKKGEEGEEPALPLRGLDSWAKIRKLADEDLLKALASEEFSYRLRAQQELVRRGDKHRPALLKLLADGEQPAPARIAALGALQSFWNDDVKKAFVERLKDSEADMRRLAAEGLSLNCGKSDQDAHDALVALLLDSERDVRRAAALAIGRIAAPGAADDLVNAFKFDDGKDRYLTDGLVHAIERLGKPAIQKLLDLSNSGEESLIPRVVTAFAGLRTAEALPSLELLLKYPHLTVDQRAALIRSYSNYLPVQPKQLEPMINYLVKHPKEDIEVKRAGLDVLSVSGTQGSDKAQAWLLALVDQGDPDLRLTLIDVVARTRLKKAAPRLAEWLADTGRSEKERRAAARALRAVADPSTAPVLKKVLSESKQPASFRIEVLRALEGVDRVEAQKSAQAFLDDAHLEIQRAGVQILGNTAAGARQVAARYLAKKLPHDLLAEVSDALRKHADRDTDVARLLARVMRGALVISLNDKAEVERIRKLVLTRGDAGRGKQLYLSNKSLACTRCHRLEGVGGSIGPDLTRIWETHSVEKVLEAIVEPSKEIKEGYQTYRAETTKGIVVTGLKVSQTREAVVLRDANGTDVRIPAKELDSLVALKTSLMPDDVVKHLSLGQVIDLVAFLKSRSAQESLRGMARKLEGKSAN